MSFIQNYYPPSRETYDLIVFCWQFYPLFGSTQWFQNWYGMGKTSVQSKLNIPGRVAWLTMEVPAIVVLVYMMSSLTAREGIEDLPWQNKVLAGLFLIHYTYRAILFPFLQPSMSPIHVVVWANAIIFHLLNSTCLGGYLGGYGPRSQSDWANIAHMSPQFSTLQFAVGVTVFFLGLSANYYHDEELREIRRREKARMERIAASGGNKSGGGGGGVAKVYQIPQAGLFQYILYPHYLVEWIEWTGFWMACGWGCVPARMFVVNEVAAMLPRAVKGRQWYVERFGEEKLKGRKAILPGVW